MRNCVLKHRLGILLCVLYLGLFTGTGRGEEKDPTIQLEAKIKSNKDKIKTLVQQNARLQFQLATCYATGHLTKQDLQKSIVLFRKAAEQGNVIAQMKLADAYLRGIGVEKNLGEAVRWLKEAEALGDKDAGSVLVDIRKMKGQFAPQQSGNPDQNSDAAPYSIAQIKAALNSVKIPASYSEIKTAKDVIPLNTKELERKKLIDKAAVKIAAYTKGKPKTWIHKGGRGLFVRSHQMNQAVFEKAFATLTNASARYQIHGSYDMDGSSSTLPAEYVLRLAGVTVADFKEILVLNKETQTVREQRSLKAAINSQLLAALRVMCDMFEKSLLTETLDSRYSWILRRLTQPKMIKVSLDGIIDIRKDISSEHYLLRQAEEKARNLWQGEIRSQLKAWVPASEHRKRSKQRRRSISSSSFLLLQTLSKQIPEMTHPKVTEAARQLQQVCKMAEENLAIVKAQATKIQRKAARKRYEEISNSSIGQAYRAGFRVGKTRRNQSLGNAPLLRLRTKYAIQEGYQIAEKAGYKGREYHAFTEGYVDGVSGIRTKY